MGLKPLWIKTPICQQTHGVGKQDSCGTTLKETMNQLNLDSSTISTELKSRIAGISRSFALDQINLFPEIRYMGSKRRLLPWIHSVLEGLDFETALDPFRETLENPDSSQ